MLVCVPPAGRKLVVEGEDGRFLSPDFGRDFVIFGTKSSGFSGFEMAKRDGDRPSWVRFSGVGIEFAAAVAGFTLVGYWIDGRYDSRPWGVLIGAILGLAGGMYNLIRVSLVAIREQRPGGGHDADGQDNDDSV